MGTFKAVKNKNQSARDMKFTIKYMLDPKKTTVDKFSLNSGINCMAQSAFTEMMTTKNRYRKTDKRMFYQFVQSFPTDTKLTPWEVHQLGLEFSQKQFPNFEVLVSTHCNTNNLHNHILVNSVSFETGKKLHQNHDDLLLHRQINDELCLKFGDTPLPTYQKGQKNKGMSSREYRSAMKGDSWKVQMMNTIDDCMKFAKSKNHFIYLMESEGYKVLWTNTRKNITYTTPEGNKSRNNKLHEDKHLKENMENEFRIRESYLARIKAEKQTDGGSTGASDKSQPRYIKSDRVDEREVAVPKQDPIQPIFTEPTNLGSAETNVKSQFYGRTDQEVGADTDGASANEQYTITGWEEERATLFATQSHQLELGKNTALMGGGNLVTNALDTAKGVESLLDDTLPAPKKVYHVDKKTLKKIREKKVAHGQNANDIGSHDFDMTMGGF